MRCEFVTSCARRGPTFEPTEVVLHLVALAVELPVEAALLFAVGFAREAVAGTKLFECQPQLVAVEALVTDDF